MRPDDKKKPASPIRRAWLQQLAVHGAAIGLSPLSYARCLWWWVTGKRLRAQLNLAPLLARAPHAYQLWLTREPALKSTQVAKAEDVSILALVQKGAGQEATHDSAVREGFAVKLVCGKDSLEPADFAEHQWIMPLKAGDLLKEGAGDHYRAAAACSDNEAIIIYADDDLISARAQRFSPHLKPDWNSELYKHFDYLTNSTILRADILDASRLQGDDWAADLSQQAVQQSASRTSSPVHLRAILHHRRMRPAPQLPQPHLDSEDQGDHWPSVSIIIPTRDRVDLLRPCLEGLAQTQYPGQVEILIIDNGSTDPATLAFLEELDPQFARVLRDDGPFNFAAINNRAAEEAAGAILCFLNNDVEVIEDNWLALMVTQCNRKEIGAVGARLLYPDGRIQHAGVVIGIGGAAAHAHRLLDPNEEGYFHRHSLPQLVSAVTAACMLVQRERFFAVGGFDAENFAVSFNDVDLCLRLGAKGWQTLYEPRATLIHRESVSRGLDRDPVGAARQAREVKALQTRWGTAFDMARPLNDTPVPDPFHHPFLSPLSEQFVLRL